MDSYKDERDIIGNHIARLVKVKCSYYATYAIDEAGHPFSWGKRTHWAPKEPLLKELPQKD